MSSDHPPQPVERHCDLAVLGGSAAGLAATLPLGRRRRSVIVVDAGPSPGAPAEPTGAGREEVRRHGVEVLDGRVSEVTSLEGGRVRLALAGGHSIVARRVLDAAGLVDEADGRRVGAAIDADLAAADEVGRRSAHASDWDGRYAGRPMWSGNPNGTLVHEIAALAPGRALDVGAGEGADALWLAEQGWQVTANDISQRALERLAAEAARRGVTVTCHCADANDPDAFESEGFDLVSAQYASIPRTPDGRGVRNLLEAVAPGGTLLVVSHDLAPMRTPIDTTSKSRVFDPDAYVRVEDVETFVARTPGWDIEVYEKRPRPGGSATAAHHVDDLVLRARRSR
jgi:SAM-dependent methyltransferase